MQAKNYAYQVRHIRKDRENGNGSCGKSEGWVSWRNVQL